MIEIWDSIFKDVYLKSNIRHSIDIRHMWETKDIDPWHKILKYLSTIYGYERVLSSLLPCQQMSQNVAGRWKDIFCICVWQTHFMIPPFRYSKVIIKMSIYFIGPLYSINEKLSFSIELNDTAILAQLIILRDLLKKIWYNYYTNQRIRN